MKKAIIAVILAAVIVAGGFLGYRYISASKKTAAQTPQYTTTQVARRNIQKVISGSGSVEAAQTDTLKAESRDEVDEVLVKANQIVAKGDKLVTFVNGSDSITAPYDGVISEISVKAGDSVAQGTALVSIFDNKNLVTKISVDEADLSSVKLEQKADIKLNAFSTESFTGKVTDIKQQGEYSNGVSSFEVTIAFDEIKAIKVGMSTEASIMVDSRQDVLAVPVEAVKGMNAAKFVFVQGSDGKQTPKRVETGLANDMFVEIKSGLTEGETVLIPRVDSTQTGMNSAKMLMGPGGFGGGGQRNFSGQSGQKRSTQSGSGGSSAPAGN